MDEPRHINKYGELVPWRALFFAFIFSIILTTIAVTAGFTLNQNFYNLTWILLIFNFGVLASELLSKKYKVFSNILLIIVFWFLVSVLIVGYDSFLNSQTNTELSYISFTRETQETLSEEFEATSKQNYDINIQNRHGEFDLEIDKFEKNSISAEYYYKDEKPTYSLIQNPARDVFNYFNTDYQINFYRLFSVSTDSIQNIKIDTLDSDTNINFKCSGEICNTKLVRGNIVDANISFEDTLCDLEISDKLDFGELNNTSIRSSDCDITNLNMFDSTNISAIDSKVKIYLSSFSNIEQSNIYIDSTNSDIEINIDRDLGFEVQYEDTNELKILDNEIDQESGNFSSSNFSNSTFKVDFSIKANNSSNIVIKYL